MANQRGRPPIGSRVAVRLPPSLLDAIDEQARASQRTRAETIRAVLRAGLDRNDLPISSTNGVDRAQVRAQLTRIPIERLRFNTVAVNRMARLRRGAAR